MTMVAEGYFASKLVTTFTDEQRKQMPIAETAYGILHENRSVRKAMKDLEELLS
jgi:glycerol-3-phosphate dehydrogenase